MESLLHSFVQAAHVSQIFSLDSREIASLDSISNLYLALLVLDCFLGVRDGNVQRADVYLFVAFLFDDDRRGNFVGV